MDIPDNLVELEAEGYYRVAAAGTSIECPYYVLVIPSPKSGVPEAPCIPSTCTDIPAAAGMSVHVDGIHGASGTPDFGLGITST